MQCSGSACMPLSLSVCVCVCVCYDLYGLTPTTTCHNGPILKNFYCKNLITVFGKLDQFYKHMQYLLHCYEKIQLRKEIKLRYTKKVLGDRPMVSKWKFFCLQLKRSFVLLWFKTSCWLNKLWLVQDKEQTTFKMIEQLNQGSLTEGEGSVQFTSLF